MRTSPLIKITLFIHFCSIHKEDRQEITSRYLNKTYGETRGKRLRKIRIRKKKLTVEIEKIHLDFFLTNFKIINEEQYSQYLQEKTLYNNGKVFNSL